MMSLPVRWLVCCTLVFEFGGVASLLAEEPAKPVKISLHPQAAPTPAIKYRLLPGRLDQKRGNAAVHYGKVSAEEMTFFANRKLRDQINDWQETPLEQLRGGKVQLPSKGHIEDAIRSGALCMECDWLLPIGDVPYYTMLLADAEQLRACSRIVAVRARIQLADHEYENAITTLQTGYAMGQHVATGETIVNGLVGIAICNFTNQQTTEFIQQVGAPNLYWALTMLPAPLIDMRRALEVERMAIELSFPELAEVRTAKKTPDEWREQYQRIFLHELGPQPGDDKSLRFPSPDELEKRCRDRLPAARQYLIGSGLPAKEVEQMPPYQVATLYTLAIFHENFDDAIKFFRLPYPEAIAGMDAVAERVKHDDKEIIPISVSTVPAIGTARSAVARLDRAIAVLRVFEALRLYAANHDDKLPNALTDVTDVPIPSDPMTGKPFEYHRDGNGATLRGPTFSGIPLDYEITMIARQK